LAQLNQFLPRIKPLRPDSVPAPNPDTSLSDQTLPFTNIKRDLVRLLSVLSFQDKGVGDLVRENGGVQVILGLCEVDERNPCELLVAMYENIADQSTRSAGTCAVHCSEFDAEQSGESGYYRSDGSFGFGRGEWGTATSPGPHEENAAFQLTHRMLFRTGLSVTQGQSDTIIGGCIQADQATLYGMHHQQQ